MLWHDDRQFDFMPPVYPAECIAISVVAGFYFDTLLKWIICYTSVCTSLMMMTWCAFSLWHEQNANRKNTKNNFVYVDWTGR